MKRINEYKLAEHFLVRTALCPYEVIEELRFNQTLEIYNLIVDKQKQLIEYRKKVCDLLFDILPLANDDKERVKILNMKRSIFNGRKINTEVYEIISLYIRTDRLIILSKWMELEKELKNLKLSCENIFNNELVHKRNILKKYIKNEEFQKGIQLTSSSVFKVLQDYLIYDMNNKKFLKSIRNAELSLLNYLNRMIMKTSPFGSFTGISIGKFTDNTSNVEVNFDIKKTKSFISYNRALITYLERAIVKINGVKEHSFITLNNTVKIQDNYICYFRRGEDGTPKAYEGESFIQLTSNALLLNIINSIQNNELLTLNELCDSILSYNKNISYLDAISYINKLLDIQILELSFNIADQEKDFLEVFIHKLGNIDTKIAKRFLFYITKLQIIQSKFGASDVNSRSRYIVKINKIINKLMEVLDKNNELNILNSKIPLYEDVKLCYNDISLKKSHFNTTLKNFEYINKLSALFDDSLLHKLIFTKLFIQKYGVGRRCDNLLEFYDYYSTEQNKIKNGAVEEFLTEESLEILETTKKLQEYLFKILSNLIDNSSLCNSVTLDGAVINDLIGKYPSTISQNESSSYYCQLLYQAKKFSNEAPDIVLDKIGTGYGKYFSRFCFMFNNERFSSTELIKSIRSGLSEYDKIYADLLAVLGINVNVHPSIFEYELIYPGCKSALGLEKQIYLNDIAVIHEQYSNKIILWSKKHNKELVLIPLGFLFPRLAPPLYNFLCYFSQASWITFSIWDRYDDWLIDKKEKIRFYPRIMIGNIIIERATWKLSKDNIVSRNSGESDYNYFIKVQEWLNTIRLPRECFVRLSSPVFSLRKQNIGNESAIKKFKLILQNKQRKPQYIDFNNMLHINIFEKLVSKAGDEITIQEVLPSGANMFNASNGQHHATEFLFEIYKR